METKFLKLIQHNFYFPFNRRLIKNTNKIKFNAFGILNDLKRERERERERSKAVLGVKSPSIRNN
jgi:hypothetical protein